jgi:hypothetical protein
MNDTYEKLMIFLENVYRLLAPIGSGSAPTLVLGGCMLIVFYAICAASLAFFVVFFRLFNPQPNAT